jgi:hypothetical protein
MRIQHVPLILVLKAKAPKIYILDMRIQHVPGKVDLKAYALM